MSAKPPSARRRTLFSFLSRRFLPLPFSFPLFAKFPPPLTYSLDGSSLGPPPPFYLPPRQVFFAAAPLDLYTPPLLSSPSASSTFFQRHRLFTGTPIFFPLFSFLLLATWNPLEPDPPTRRAPFFSGRFPSCGGPGVSNPPIRAGRSLFPRERASSLFFLSPDNLPCLMRFPRA